MYNVCGRMASRQNRCHAQLLRDLDLMQIGISWGNSAMPDDVFISKVRDGTYTTRELGRMLLVNPPDTVKLYIEKELNHRKVLLRETYPNIILERIAADPQKCIFCNGLSGFNTIEEKEEAIAREDPPLPDPTGGDDDDDDALFLPYYDVHFYSQIGKVLHGGPLNTFNGVSLCHGCVRSTLSPDWGSGEPSNWIRSFDGDESPDGKWKTPVSPAYFEHDIDDYLNWTNWYFWGKIANQWMFCVIPKPPKVPDDEFEQMMEGEDWPVAPDYVPPPEDDDNYEGLD